MRSEQRQEYILENARKNSFISITDTAKILGVSIETVRRDINILCQKSLLKKVHGGAAPVKLSIRKDSQFMTRIHENQQAKMTIGMEAAKMIRSGDVVTMDGGATCYVLASCISGVRDVTFVINSLRIATVLMEKIGTGDITGDIIMLGGKLEPSSYCSSDNIALESLSHFHFDKVFVSCSSFSKDSVANSSSSSSIIVRRMMENSNSSILIADSDKLGKHSVYTFAKPTDFDRIIIDNKIPCPTDFLDSLHGTDTQLTIVDCN